tara:strand:- start:137 stop:2218 length:2082 start_codon:yes stop_codon:yes gene_type:complete
MRVFILLLLLVNLSLYSQNNLDNKEKKAEKLFLSLVNPDSFKSHLKELTKKPHVSGSIASKEVQKYIEKTMSNAGLDVTLYPYDVYMSKEPGNSLVEIVLPSREPLNQQEDILKEDPYSNDPGLWKGWNAYSGSGDVTSEIVYANYGRKEDFEKLNTLGVSIKGKIVIARYGGNFRGYKAKFAQENGAIGLIIYTDPKDSGFTKGLVYPEGPYYNESTIQRGSLKTQKFSGDPLTPFEPALPLDNRKKIKRLNPEKVELHKIPVTPLSYGAAQKILEKMTGNPVPSSWQGGLPFTYRIEGGSSLKVRLKVDQNRNYVRINNVIGSIKGDKYPNEWIILGCHLDAWGFGATDPSSGTAMLLSLSESLGKLISNGYKPKRSILIGHWDAEEHGLIGSTEWVEQMREELSAKGVAYLNFDGAVSGKKFGASSAPSLKKLIVDATKEVKYPYSDETVFSFWKREEQNEEPPIGNLGGGSDHVAFYMHLGIPSMSGGSGGTTLYHSNYDSFHYYENFVDPEFKMGQTIEKIAGIMALRLANSEIILYDVERYAKDLKIHFERVENKIKKYDSKFKGFNLSNESIIKLSESSSELSSKILLANKEKKLTRKKIKSINKQMISLEKSFIDHKGMYYGNWYRSLYASSDPFSGYGAWILPGIEYEIAMKSSKKLDEWDSRYSNSITDLNQKMKKLILVLSN